MFAFDWLTDPAAWAGLLTLVVLEIVLGIDNLVFVAILADKLPAQQRDRGRLMGLGIALLMRLLLLAAMSWLVQLTTPILSWWRRSWRWTWCSRWIR
jgi:predicted tellurium resistance membrane protein TerC